MCDNIYFISQVLKARALKIQVIYQPETHPGVVWSLPDLISTLQWATYMEPDKAEEVLHIFLTGGL